MTRVKRWIYFISGLLLLGICVIIDAFPNIGYGLTLLLMVSSMMIRGLQNLFYYFTMAKYTVGGIVVLYKGILFLDASLFAFNLDDLPKEYVMLYLLAGMLANGLIDLLRVREVIQSGSRHWKYQLFTGAFKILISIVSVVFIHSGKILSIVYTIGLAHTAISRMVMAVRDTSIVYIKP